MNQKILLTALFTTACLSAEANVVWPMLNIYIGKHVILFPIIFGSILVEAVIIKWITKHPWGKSILLTCIVNLISAALGLALAFAGGFAFGLISMISSFKAFSLVDWIIETIFYGLVSSLIEFQALRYIGRFKFFHYKVQGFKSKAYLAFITINLITAGAATYYMVFVSGMVK